jgi:hemerythrin
MLLSETRTLLLSQHDAIRALTARVLTASECVPAQQDSAMSDLRSAIDALGIALTNHNRDEQRLLEKELPTIDAWGAVRSAAMDDRHRREHASMRSALIASTQMTDPAALNAHLRWLIDEILEHMTFEERVILHPDVLRDDSCTIDSFGG